MNATETPTENQDPPLFAGTPNELDDNGETQADRDAAGEQIRQRTRARAHEAGADYEQVREPLKHNASDFDQNAAEADRQAELDRAREAHNRNTAGFATS